MSLRDRFAAAVRAPEVDLGEAALLMGAEVELDFDPAEWLGELGRLAAAVRAELGGGPPAESADGLSNEPPAQAGSVDSPGDAPGDFPGGVPADSPTDFPGGFPGDVPGDVPGDAPAGATPHFPADAGPRAAAAALARVLGVRERFRGGPDEYADLRSSLLHEVLRRRRGLPILLSVVWIEVGRRAGLPVYGVALPGHFVVGVGDPDGAFVLADPFRGGVPLSEQDARRIAGEAGGDPADPALLRPAPAHTVLLRMLNNVRAWASRPEQALDGAWTRLWAVELSLLLPRHPAALRHERGALLARTGRFVDGAVQLEEYAALVDRLDPAVAAKIRAEARAARARLN